MPGMASRRVSIGVRSTPAGLRNRTPSRAAARARTPAGKTPGKTPNKASEAPVGSVQVVIRVRPENSKEQQGNYKVVVAPMDKQCLVFDPAEEEAPDFFHGQRRTGRDMLKKQSKDMKFMFDRVFNNQASNEEVYEETTKKLLSGLLNGFNCSVFAYGATGAGKTFTMLGTLRQPGVMFLTMMDLYQRIELMKETKTCEIAVSYLEVYNEQIKDLLLPSGYLPVREDAHNGVVVNGLSLHKPRNAEELLHMLDFGNKNRTQHPTDANAESSRSHAVLQVFVRQKDRTANISADVKVAKMSLIDLAGSERATATRNLGKRFREGANINRSLLALGNCINALAEGKSRAFIPYRDSKLTRLLKDSLGGNCRTVMIAAVSPSAMSYEDTYNTLKYANRAKNIKVEVKSNVMNVDFHVTKYQQIVEDLRAEVSELKLKLNQYESNSGMGDAAVAVMSKPFMEEMYRIQSSIGDVFHQRVSTRKELLEYESSQKELAFKINNKQRALNRLVIISDALYDKEKTMARYRRFIANSEKRLETVKQRCMPCEKKMQANTAKLQQIEEEFKASQVANNELASQVLSQSLRCHHLEVELRDTKRQVRYMKKLCRLQGCEVQSSDKLITSLLKIVQRQFYLLKSAGLGTSDVVQDYETVLQEVEGEREVAWADQSVLDTTIPDVPATEISTLNYNTLLNFPVLSQVPLTPAKVKMIGIGKSPVDQNASLSDRTSQMLATPGFTPAGDGTSYIETPASDVSTTPGVISAISTSTPGAPVSNDISTPCVSSPAANLTFTPGIGTLAITPCAGTPEGSLSPETEGSAESRARRTLAEMLSGPNVTLSDSRHRAESERELNSTFSLDGVAPLPPTPSGADKPTLFNVSYSVPEPTVIMNTHQHPVNNIARNHTHQHPLSNTIHNHTQHNINQSHAQSSHLKKSHPSNHQKQDHEYQNGHHQQFSHQNRHHQGNSHQNGHAQANHNRTQSHQNGHPQANHHQTQSHQPHNPHHKPVNHHSMQHNRHKHALDDKHVAHDTNSQHTDSLQKHTNHPTLHVAELATALPLNTTITLEPPKLQTAHSLDTTVTLEPASLSCLLKTKSIAVPSSLMVGSPDMPSTPHRPSPNQPTSKRVVNFEQENVQSPAVGKMTFAEVVKSPAPIKRTLELQQCETPRSPLSSRENLPHTGQQPSHSKEPRSSAQSSDKKKWKRLVGSGSKLTKIEAFPSVIENIRRVRSFHKHDAPRYMQMTKAATRRHKNHRRSLSGSLEPLPKSAIPAPRRLLSSSVENKEHQSSRSLAQTRWQSSVSLGQRSTFL